MARGPARVALPPAQTPALFKIDESCNYLHYYSTIDDLVDGAKVSCRAHSQ